MPKQTILTLVTGLVLGLFLNGSALAKPLIPLDSLNKVIEQATTNHYLHKVKGCHGKRKFHMVHKWGFKAWHRHNKYCKPKPAKKPGKHCHGKWKHHWHSGWGTHWHRHAGPNCYYQKGIVKSYWGYGCIKIGKFWICP